MAFKMRTSPFDFVLERLLQLLTAHDQLRWKRGDGQPISSRPITGTLTDLKLAPLPILPHELGFKLSLLLVGEHTRCFFQNLACITGDQGTTRQTRELDLRSCPSWNRHWMYWIGVFSRWRSVNDDLRYEAPIRANESQSIRTHRYGGLRAVKHIRCAAQDACIPYPLGALSHPGT